jgi:hypothetical protein
VEWATSTSTRLPEGNLQVEIEWGLLTQNTHEHCKMHGVVWWVLPTPLIHSLNMFFIPFVLWNELL